MKKQKISLSLRKQKISSLSGKQVQGGNFTVQIVTIRPTCISVFQNCTSVIIRCEPLITAPSGCTSCPITTHTNTVTVPTMTTC